MNKPSKAKIFFSYSHKDEDLREQLNTHLSILSRSELVSEWHDRKILAGENWQSEIDNNLYESDIILLLISPDFIASDYCYGNELSKAIERHEANQAIVIPIIIRPVNWGIAPFASLQALPKDAKAVTTWSNIDEAWMDVSEGIQKAITNIGKLKNRQDKNIGLKTVSELLANEAERLDQMFSKENYSFSGIPTGINDLDSQIDGLHPSDLIVLASRPENGAAEFALNIAKNVAINSGLPVAFYSFQLPASRITQKLICSIGGINHHRLLRGLFEEEDWVSLTNALGMLNNAPLYIDDSNQLSVPDILSKAKELKSRDGLALIIIDSLQSLAFQSELKGSVKNYFKSLKYLAKELQVPIVVTSNVSTDVYHRVDKRPVISDLGDWRSIEDDADVIIFTFVGEDDFDGVEKGTVEILTVKNSYGPVGRVRAMYAQEKLEFSNYQS